MIAYACFALIAVLALRSFFLAIAERKLVVLRLLDFLIATVFGIVAAVLYLYADTIKGSVFPAAGYLLLFGVIAGLFLILRLRKPYRSRPVLTFLKALVAVVIFACAFLILMGSGFLYLTHDQPVMKIIMTGNERSQFVEWQPPNGQQHRQDLVTHEILFQTPEGKPLSRLFMYGDQVVLKAKVIRFRPELNWIGFQNLCRIEYVYNGYTTVKRFNEYPHHAEELPAAHPRLARVQEAFWRFWEELYYQQSRSVWIKSATLESNYLPLVQPDGRPFRGAFFLTITSGGLSAVPLP